MSEATFPLQERGAGRPLGSSEGVRCYDVGWPLEVAEVVEVQLVFGLHKGDPRDSLGSAPLCANGGVEAIGQFLRSAECLQLLLEESNILLVLGNHVLHHEDRLRVEPVLLKLVDKVSKADELRAFY